MEINMELNTIWDKRKFAGGVILILFLWCVSSLANTETVFVDSVEKRFEYKLSFKGPYLVLRNGSVPFWEHHGSAIASDESVRITPSLRSKKGSIWSRELSRLKNWEVEVTFRISGRGRVGADGLAVWYTAERSEDGPVFGSKDTWNGLGVFFDSFDNDNKHNNPYIMAMVNDGTKVYNHEVDGHDQQLGGCLRDFRNRPYPNKVKIEYNKNTLTVYFNTGLTENDNNYELCMKADNVVLPPEGFFGVSAATGGLADDHDVISFLTSSLHPQSLTEADNKAVQDEKLKMEKEYQEYQDKMNKAREEYKKENPETKSELAVNENDYYEAQETRELRQIFEGQHQITNAIKSSINTLNEIFSKQDKQFGLLHEMSQRLAQVPGSARHQMDLENVMRAQTVFSEDIKELKGHVYELSNRLGSFTTQDNAKSERFAQVVHSKVQEEIRLVSNQLSVLQNSQAAFQGSTSCVQYSHLFICLSVQLAIIIGFLVYQARKVAAAKKLF